MKTLPSTIHGVDDPFAPTHWSVILAAQGDEDPRAAEVALATLCQTYWAPLYTFVRRRGYDLHDARDLTQSFFAHLIAHRIYERTDPRKGKFRAFLLAAMKNFLANARAREMALKRGGAKVVLPLHEAAAQEAERVCAAQLSTAELKVDPERSFEQSWAQAVIDAAMERVGQLYFAEGKENLFTSLRPFIGGDADTLPSYDQMAAVLRMPASTVRSHVTRLRQRFREALHTEVRRTVNSEAEVREELFALRRALSGS